MLIYVVLLPDKLIPIECQSNDLIKNIKEKLILQLPELKNFLGRFSSQYKLTIEQSLNIRIELEDRNTLEFYDINDDSIINVEKTTNNVQADAGNTRSFRQKVNDLFNKHISHHSQTENERSLTSIDWIHQRKENIYTEEINSSEYNNTAFSATYMFHFYFVLCVADATTPFEDQTTVSVPHQLTDLDNTNFNLLNPDQNYEEYHSETASSSYFCVQSDNENNNNKYAKPLSSRENEYQHIYSELSVNDEISTCLCEICQDKVKYEDIYVLDCDHKLCYSCYARMCESKYNNQDLLACFQCNRALTDSELNHLRLNKHIIKEYKDYQCTKMLNIYAQRTKGVIKCPGRTCKWMAEADDPYDRFKVTCKLCKTKFCSLCNRSPYHYVIECNEIPKIIEQWHLWCNQERGRHLRQRASENEAYRKQLNDYNNAAEANKKRNDELKRRHEDLMADESYKQNKCKYCPKCNRVIEKLEGTQILEIF
ncbi:unnamed protein product [Didymodactylos carnosus]|uniref:RBR-type E3 ubiquitin transferase n=1 Tax=Didymodactylos carnosus TaxID=1234261 RepID=A0A815JGG8_9BILA|nr:unnamed protein product [Didymodactylos carnosus]CAF1379069.1 unnamed protein product [Didymodactylos carnosus]CAF4086033.1 unnamed protein product [Didymodactylos carnosus]CAF4272337.1 unnamed protein product [Didymodactylos carnosus]